MEAYLQPISIHDDLNENVVVKVAVDEHGQRLQSKQQSGPTWDDDIMINNLSRISIHIVSLFLLYIYRFVSNCTARFI